MATKKVTSASTSKSAETSRWGSAGKLSQQELNNLIAKKAYSYYQKRGFTHGDDQSDWYKAEKEVRLGLKK